MKKLLFLFALSLYSLAAWAAPFDVEVYPGQTLRFTPINGTTNEVSVAKTSTALSGNLVIPSTITYGGTDYTVTTIGNFAFNACSSLTSVTIPNSVTTIGNFAFDACSSLTSVTILNSVTTIGNFAFDACSSLTSVIIPNSVTSIGDYAFCFCSDLTNITIGNSVTTIGDYAFNGCSGLTGSLTIPNSVTAIGVGAFYGCSLTSVTISNSITTIKEYTFYQCFSLTSVTIPNSVASIGDYAFYNCSDLISLTIGNSVTTIGKSAFAECSSLANIQIASGNTKYDSRNNCNAIIETATNTLLLGCKNSIIPNSVTTIGNAAFAGCSSLASVTIPNSVTTIGYGAFSRCSGLTSATIPNSVTTIGGEAFCACSGLANVTIPNSVTTIGERAFYSCSGLTGVTIPNSVTTIGDNAFSWCTNLKTVYNLSNLSITNSDYGLNVYRIVNCTEYSGAGDNSIYKIPTSYTFVDVEDDVETHIPRSTIPTNFIYKDGSVWKAKNIVLTDGQDAFEAPETFTAETATYTREFTNSNRSTLYLPFTAAIPENFEVYDFTSFANNTISFTKREDSIYAYTPYLVGYDLSKDGNTTTCTITKTNAVFPKSESANYHPVTRNGMTFQGVLERTEMTSTNNYGYSNGFFVQSGGSAHVNPFRCYFTYSPSGNAPQTLPPSLNVEFGYGDPVGIDAVETPEQEYDGRYGKDVYDMLGRLVRKNADNLEGLPQGIYIWKGKKHFNN